MLPFPEKKKKRQTLQIRQRRINTKSIVTASFVKHLKILKWKAFIILQEVIARNNGYRPSLNVREA